MVYIDAIEYLLKNGADIAVWNRNGISAIDLAKDKKLLVTICKFICKDESLSEKFTDYICPVCLELPNIAYTCKRDHLLCGDCKPKLLSKKHSLC